MDLHSPNSEQTAPDKVPRSDKRKAPPPPLQLDPSINFTNGSSQPLQNEYSQEKGSPSTRTPPTAETWKFIRSYLYGDSTGSHRPGDNDGVAKCTSPSLENSGATPKEERSETLTEKDSRLLREIEESIAAAVEAAENGVSDSIKWWDGNPPAVATETEISPMQIPVSRKSSATSTGSSRKIRFTPINPSQRHRAKQSQQRQQEQQEQGVTKGPDSSETARDQWSMRSAERSLLLRFLQLAQSNQLQNQDFIRQNFEAMWQLWKARNTSGAPGGFLDLIPSIDAVPDEFWTAKAEAWAAEHEVDVTPKSFGWSAGLLYLVSSGTMDVATIVDLSANYAGYAARRMREEEWKKTTEGIELFEAAVNSRGHDAESLPDYRDSISLPSGSSGGLRLAEQTKPELQADSSEAHPDTRLFTATYENSIHRRARPDKWHKEQLSGSDTYMSKSEEVMDQRESYRSNNPSPSSHHNSKDDRGSIPLIEEGLDELFFQSNDASGTQPVEDAVGHNGLRRAEPVNTDISDAHEQEEQNRNQGKAQISESQRAEVAPPQSQLLLQPHLLPSDDEDVYSTTGLTPQPILTSRLPTPIPVDDTVTPLSLQETESFCVGLHSRLRESLDQEGIESEHESQLDDNVNKGIPKVRGTGTQATAEAESGENQTSQPIERSPKPEAYTVVLPKQGERIHLEQEVEKLLNLQKVVGNLQKNSIELTESSQLTKADDRTQNEEVRNLQKEAKAEYSQLGVPGLEQMQELLSSRVIGHDKRSQNDTPSPPRDISPLTPPPPSSPSYLQPSTSKNEAPRLHKLSPQPSPPEPAHSAQNPPSSPEPGIQDTSTPAPGPQIIITGVPTSSIESQSNQTKIQSPDKLKPPQQRMSRAKATQNGAHSLLPASKATTSPTSSTRKTRSQTAHLPPPISRWGIDEGIQNLRARVTKKRRGGENVDGGKAKKRAKANAAERDERKPKKKKASQDKDVSEMNGSV